MSDDYLPSGTVAHRRFDHAKRQAFVESITALMRSRPDDLLPFEDVQKKLGLRITRDRGLQQVPLDKIVGSVGKYREFTRSFWPKQEKLRERWKWIFVAAHPSTGCRRSSCIRSARSSSSRTAITASPWPVNWATEASRPTSPSTSARCR